MEERFYWLGFSVFPGVGPVKFNLLLSKFGTAKNAWEAAKSDLAKLIGEEQAERFDSFRKEFSIEKYKEDLEKKDVWFLILKDKEYPKLLSQIPNPPFVLYGKGQVPDGTWFSKSIAVVGARKTTEYGREVTKLLTTELVLNGFTIVSGLAMGVDAISHQTTIENGGKTIAVLGCGVDCCYPRENKNIYNSITNSNGCIISEYPLGSPPNKGSFPARNRIIAGLSLGVLVTEGAEDSGSLITANFALKFNRKVFAVPGPITSNMSKGPYALIQKGATLVTSSKDIISELGISNFLASRRSGQFPISNKPNITGTKEENIILKLLENEALHFDEIVRRTKFSSSKLSSILSLMEIKGMVKSLGNGQFCIAS